MSRKKRNIEVLSVKLRFADDEPRTVTFSEILNCLNGREYRFQEKIFNFSLLQTDKLNCIAGIIITTQDSDIPPKRNKFTGVYNTIQIDVQTEGFAYANIFLYDTDRNILLYEINKNGCFPNQLKEFIYSSWNADEENVRFDISFPPVLRLNEYDRMLRMDRYKKIKIELFNPVDLVDSIRESTDSIYNNILKSNINFGAQTNANTIIIEQTAFQKRINLEGLSHSMVRGLVNAVRQHIRQNNIQTLTVEGYDSDSEDPNRCKIIDLVGDTFKEYFWITDIQIHSDVQQSERKEGIEDLYDRLLPEFRQLIGR